MSKSIDEQIDQVLIDLVTEWVDFLHNGKNGEGTERLLEKKLQIKSLIAQAEKEARIDELENLETSDVGDCDIFYHGQHIDDRLSELREEQDNE